MKYLFIVAIAALSCSKQNTDSIYLQTSSNAVTQVRQTTVVPVDFLIFNDCTNEWVHFTGEMETKIHAVRNQDNLHGGDRQTYHNTVGVGQSSGNVYTLKSHSSSQANSVNSTTTEKDPFNFHITSRIVFSTKEGSDWVIIFRAHVVKNANDVVTVAYEDIEGFCK